MANPIQIGDRLLVIFDGQCGLCNGAVRWFARHDRLDRLRFAPSDSPKVAELLTRHSIAVASTGTDLETILVVRDAGGAEERLLIRSAAVLMLLQELPSPWPMLSAALAWIPKSVLDLTYRLIARWRYHIRRRQDRCPVLTAQERFHFL